MTDKFDDLGFAKLDLSRGKRTKANETIYCAGKTKEQLLGIVKSFQENGLSVLGTRCSQEQADFVISSGVSVQYDPVSKILVSSAGNRPSVLGSVAVCTGGTADIPVAEEAAQTIEFFGGTVCRHFDVGISGIHRLFSKIEEIRKADVVITVAGMEGALGSVVAGLVDSPVIAVPTSVGYGASFNGLAPLLTMLNSCAEGISVVNIDNGFGAGMLACRMLHLKEK